MKRLLRATPGAAAMCLMLGACGGNGTEPPADADYSQLRIAEFRDGGLRNVSRDKDLLQALRNGVRLTLRGHPSPAALAGFDAEGRPSFSTTTVHVEGVDEADPLKYDGRFIGGENIIGALWDSAGGVEVKL